VDAYPSIIYNATQVNELMSSEVMDRSQTGLHFIYPVADTYLEE